MIDISQLSLIHISAIISAMVSVNFDSDDLLLDISIATSMEGVINQKGIALNGKYQKGLNI